MPRIFINYRRADSSTASGRIYKDLRQAFGKNAIFKDVDDIPLGTDFRQIIREATEVCEVMLVVIGPDWLEARDENGVSRLDEPDDFVRFEIELALHRHGIAVIPVLVEGAKIPPAFMLPPSIRELAFKNAFVIHDDPVFDHDVQTLVRLLRRIMHDPNRGRLDLAVRGFILLIAFILIALIYISQSAAGDVSPRPTRQPTRIAVDATTTVTPPTPSNPPTLAQNQPTAYAPVAIPTTYSGGASVNADAPLLLVYNADTFVMVNQSDHVRNVYDLVFEQRSATTVSIFRASRWQTDTLINFREGDCLMLWRLYLPMVETPDYCASRRAWREIGSPFRFWLSSDPNATFQVLDSGRVLATCPVNLGDCGVELD